MRLRRPSSACPAPAQPALGQFSLLFQSLVLALTVSVAACTGVNPNYCDGAKSCGAGFVCNEAARRCLPVETDSGLPGTPDLGAPQSDTAPIAQPEAGAGVEAGVAPKDDGGSNLGAACGKAGDCPSGHCVDGVCCESACAGSCMTCNAAGNAGSCVPAPAGSDTRGDCASSVTTCAGSCNGSGACSFPDAKTSCTSPSCAAGELTTGACDTQGGCLQSKTSCGGLICANASSCKTSCTADTDCLGTNVTCVAGSCTAVKANGESCGQNSKLCKSGHCVDGVCCDNACAGACSACNLPGKVGSCSPEPDGTTCGVDSCASAMFTAPRCNSGACKTTPTACFPYLCAKGGAAACATACAKDSECASGHYCDAGACKLEIKNGQPCGANNQCKSGLCTAKEKVCCDRACGGECESCKGNSSCTFEPAGTVCNKTSPDACVDEPATSFLSKWRCSGSSGSCQQNKTSCSGYKCSGPSCLKACAKHGDCVSGVCRLWSDQTCELPSAVCHVDASAAAAGNGTVTAPYRTISPCLTAKAAIIGVASGTYDEDLQFSAQTLLVNKDSAPTTKLPTNVVLRPVSLGLRVNFGATVTLRDVRIAGHSGAPTVSPLVTVVSTSSDLTLINSSLVDAQNEALVTPAATLTLTDVRIDNAKGNALRATGATVTVNRLTINKAGSRGFELDGGSLSGSDLKVFDSKGDGISLEGSIDLERLTSQGNAHVGLQLRYGTTGRLSNLLITHNGLHGVTTGDLTMVINYATVTHNNSLGTQLDCNTSIQRPTFNNSIIWSPTGSSVAGSCDFWGSDVNGIAPTYGNYSTDPKFVSPWIPSGPASCVEYSCVDFRLQLTSPCINAGITIPPPVPSTDLDGKNRYYNKKGDSGAYEHQGTSLGS
jgi:hypothetical protein